MYDEDPVVNDIVLAVINDGDGTQCGYSYKDRVASTHNRDFTAFLQMARAYKPAAPRTARFKARDILFLYYQEHIKEL